MKSRMRSITSITTNGHYIHKTRRHNTKPIAFHFYQTHPCVLSSEFYFFLLFPPPPDVVTGAPRFVEHSPIGPVSALSNSSESSPSSSSSLPSLERFVEHYLWREGVVRKDHHPPTSSSLSIYVARNCCKESQASAAVGELV